VQGEHRALDLLEVLQLHLVEPDQLDPDPGGAGHADQRVRVRGVDLLDVPVRDEVAHRRTPVAGHDHAAYARDRDDRGGVWSHVGGEPGRQRPAAGQQLGRGEAQKLREGRRLRRGKSGW
jgi:hypothetical protein